MWVWNILFILEGSNLRICSEESTLEAHSTGLGDSVWEGLQPSHGGVEGAEPVGSILWLRVSNCRPQSPGWPRRRTCFCMHIGGLGLVFTVGFFPVCMDNLTHTILLTLRQVIQDNSPGRSSFYTLSLKVTQHHFQHNMLHTDKARSQAQTGERNWLHLLWRNHYGNRFFVFCFSSHKKGQD